MPSFITKSIIVLLFAVSTVYAQSHSHDHETQPETSEFLLYPEITFEHSNLALDPTKPPLTYDEQQIIFSHFESSTSFCSFLATNSKPIVFHNEMGKNIAPISIYEQQRLLLEITRSLFLTRPSFHHDNIHDVNRAIVMVPLLWLNKEMQRMGYSSNFMKQQSSQLAQGKYLPDWSVVVHIRNRLLLWIRMLPNC